MSDVADPREPPQADAAEAFARQLAELGGDQPDRERRREAYAVLRSCAEIEAARLGVGAGYRLRLAAEHAIMANEAAHMAVEPARKLDMAAVWREVEALAQAVPSPPPPGSAAGALFSSGFRGDGAQRPSGRITVFRRLLIIVALWLRAMKSDAAADRIGYAWFLLEPIMSVGFITVVALLLHAPYVFDMPAYPFAILGVISWDTFRFAAMAAMSNGGTIIHQMDHPPVRRFDVIVAKALNGFVIYSLVGMIMMGSAIALDFTTLPEDPLLLVGAFLLVWLLGLSYGAVVGSLQMRYGGVRRVNSILLRTVALTSGLFYVTEQLPPDLQVFVIWNPLIHLVQIIRSAWFVEYDSVDASLPYVAIWLGGLMILALMCMTVDERRPRGA